jgi:MFS family permease
MSKDGDPKQYHTGGKSAHFIMVVCTLLFIVNYMDRQVFSAVLQPMKVDLGLTDAQCGLASTVFLLCMPILSIFIAYLVDRWSRKKSLGIMALFWSVFTFATGLAPNFVGLLIPRALVGVGEAGFVPGGNAMISASYSPESRGKAMGIFNMAIPIGAAIGVMVGGIVAAKYGWRTPFFYFAIPGVILGILAFFMKDYKTTDTAGTGGTNRNLGTALAAVLKLRTVRWLYPALGLTVFMSATFLIWTPALIMRLLNYDAGQAGTLAGFFGLVAIIGMPLGGFLADRWHKKDPRGRMYLAAVSNIVGAVLIAGAVLLKLNTIGIVLGFLYGIAVSVSIPAFATVYLDIVPVAHRGMSTSLGLVAQYVLGGAWGPYVIGAVSDAWGGGGSGLANALLICCVVGVIGAIFYILGAKDYAADAEKIKHEAVLAA